MKILKNFVFNHAGPIGIAAMVAWAVVGFLLVDNFPDSLNQLHRFGTYTFIVLYFVGMQVSWYKDFDSQRSNELGLWLAMVCVVGLGWSQPQYTYLILLVIFGGILPYFYSIITSVVFILITYGLTLGLSIYYWHNEDAFLVSITYLSFTAFAFFASYTAQREIQGREELAIANKQLLATQQLLTDSAVNDERLRISRDLHDALGHHLTALSLQLEVAKKLAQDKALSHVEQAQAISKLLLADVRQVVADVRSLPNVDIRASLNQLAQSAKATVNLEIADNLHIANSRIAETLFRLVQEIVTNSNRHSKTGRLNIRLFENDNAWLLQANDDGKTALNIVPGAGINGMRERVQDMGGTFTLSTQHGMHYEIRLPKND